MPRPRREETVPARIRLSSQGVANRICEEHNLAALADAVSAALRGWDMLTPEQQAECLGQGVPVPGAERDELEEEEPEEDRPWWEDPDLQDFVR